MTEQQQKLIVEVNMIKSDRIKLEIGEKNLSFSILQMQSRET